MLVLDRKHNGGEIGQSMSPVGLETDRSLGMMGVGIMTCSVKGKNYRLSDKIISGHSKVLESEYI